MILTTFDQEMEISAGVRRHAERAGCALKECRLADTWFDHSTDVTFDW